MAYPQITPLLPRCCLRSLQDKQRKVSPSFPVSERQLWNWHFCTADKTPYHCQFLPNNNNSNNKSPFFSLPCGKACAKPFHGFSYRLGLDWLGLRSHGLCACLCLCGSLVKGSWLTRKATDDTVGGPKMPGSLVQTYQLRSILKDLESGI